MNAHLAGMRVLDFSRLIPGPYCTHILGRLGAEVIKIETPLTGDWARHAPAELGYGTVFEALNEGKLSVAINYRNPAGRDLTLKLIERADVLVESQKPGWMDRRGLGYPNLRSVNPGLVYCSLSGYGASGPVADQAGHDLNFLARGGLLSLLRDHSSRPITPGVQIADLAGGLNAASAILGALVGRSRTGEGAYVELGLLDAVIDWLAPLRGAGDGDGPALGGHLPCYNVYQASDGRWLSLGALEPQFWASFCERIDRRDMVERQFDRSAVGEVASAIASRTRGAWLARFRGADACLAPVHTPAEAWTDAQVRNRRARQASSSRAAAPALGQDTVRVLQELGLSEVAIRGLETQGVVATPTSRANDRVLGRIDRLTRSRSGRTS